MPFQLQAWPNLRCTIRSESEEMLEADPKRKEAQGEDRNWMAVGIAFGAVAVVVLVLLFTVGRRHEATEMDSAYIAQVHLSDFAMSESGNLAGGKVTYLDGKVTNAGGKTVVGIRVRLLFHNAAGQVSENSTMPLNLIRMREPYIDTVPVAESPMKPGETREFRLILDQVTPDWDGQYPQVTVDGVSTR